MTVTSVAPRGAFLVDVAGLEVAWEDDPGVPQQLGPGVHVAEGPVVVAFAHQVIDAAGRIVGVGAGAAGGVEQADVEQAGRRLRVVEHQVFRDGGDLKALAVDRDGGAKQAAGAGLVGGQEAGDGDAEGEHLRCIVVAADGDDLDAFAEQAAELLHEELARSPVLPVAVVEVSGEQDELDPAFQGEVHQVDQGLAGCAADPLDRRLRVQALQRAVQVQVGRVQEGEIGHGRRLDRFRTGGRLSFRPD